MDATSSQMSKPMMLAPSSASRMAWDRPCPRATPLMNATLPSSFPIVSPVAFDAGGPAAAPDNRVSV